MANAVASHPHYVACLISMGQTPLTVFVAATGQEGGEEQSAAQPSPEVSAADLQSSLDAVSRIEKILDEQVVINASDAAY